MTTEAAEVRVAAFCNGHRLKFLRGRLGLTKRSAWQAPEMMAHFLAADAMLRSPVVVARADGDLGNASRVLLEIGCPLCFLPGEALDVLAHLVRMGPRYYNAVRRGTIRDDVWAGFLARVSGFEAPPSLAEVPPT